MGSLWRVLALAATSRPSLVENCGDLQGMVWCCWGVPWQKLDNAWWKSVLKPHEGFDEAQASISQQDDLERILPRWAQSGKHGYAVWPEQSVHWVLESDEGAMENEHNDQGAIPNGRKIKGNYVQKSNQTDHQTARYSGLDACINLHRSSKWPSRPRLQGHRIWHVGQSFSLWQR